MNILSEINRPKAKQTIKPINSLIFFCLSLITKLVILYLVTDTSSLSPDYYLLFPFFLWQDVLTAGLIFICCDGGLILVRGLRKGILAFSLMFFSYTFFFLAVLLTLLSLKFYFLVGTYLTASLMKYADSISQFSQGILHEFDVQAVILLSCAVFCLLGSLLIRRRLSRKKSGTRYHGSGYGLAGHHRTGRIMTGTGLLIYFILSLLICKVYFSGRNLFALDRNPVLDMAFSLFDLRGTTVHQVAAPTAQSLIAESGNQLESGSAEPTPGLDMHPEAESVFKQPVTAVETQTMQIPQVTTSIPDPDQPDLSGDQPVRNLPLPAVFQATSPLNPETTTDAVPVNLYSGQPGKKYNVILYKFESTASNYLSALNKDFQPFTQNLNRIAESGLLLANHYSQEPASLKAMYSILSGKYSYKTREWKEYVAKSRKDKFLSQILADEGYLTVFAGTGNGRVYLQNDMLEGKFDTILDKNGLKTQGTAYRDYGLGLDDRALVEYLAEFLAAERQPFFLFFCPVFPHHPYNVPAEEFIIREGQQNFDHYKNALYYSDYVIGLIYNTLENSGLLEDTILIIVADHGEAFYQHPRNFIHSIYLYEENVHTFCIFSNPRLFSGSVCHEITRHVDILPSLLDLLRIDTGVEVDGRTIFQPGQTQYAPFYTGFSDPYLGLRDGQWKYIINRLYNSEELYDLENDAGEKINLADAFPGLCSLFREELLLLENYINRP